MKTGDIVRKLDLGNSVAEFDKELEKYFVETEPCEHDVDIRTGVMSDQTIELTGARGRKAYPGTLRRVGYWDEETQRSYVFVTHNTTWVGKTIADLYKSRWQIELFFKWIKQNLKVKRFVGRSKNAVLSQLWVARACTCCWPT